MAAASIGLEGHRCLHSYSVAPSCHSNSDKISEALKSSQVAAEVADVSLGELQIDTDQSRSQLSSSSTSKTGKNE